ncbi:MAG: response regulator [Bacteroidota bacterium]
MEEKIKILIIEDNPGDVRLISIYLKEFFGDKYSFSTSDYLWKSLELLSENTFDVIILDLSLPDSSGLETFKKIYEHSPQIPIIVLTGLEDESVGINAMKLGAQDFLVKGIIKGKELSRSINYSIERFKLLKALSENAKKLEEKTLDLLKEQIKLANAQKLSHLGSWEWDVQANTITWSDELYRIFDLRKDEFNGSFEEYINLIHPADREYSRSVLEGSNRTLKPFNFHHKIVLNDKSVKVVHSIGEVITDEENRPVKMQGTAQDVTELFHKEELEKLVLAATQSYNSVIIFDRSQTVEWVNEGFTRLTDYTLNDLKHKSIAILRGGDGRGLSQQKNILDLILKEKKPVTYENINYTKQGKEYWVITTATPILGKDGEVERIIAIESDISLRKKIEEELVEANKIAEQSLNKVNKTLDELIKAKKELEESMKVKEQFMANMSHEIRTPMNAIVGFTDLLLKTELSTEQKQYIDAVKTSGKNLLVIINDILDFSKIQSGKFVFEQIKFRLSHVISTISELMLPKATEKNLQLLAEIDPNIPDGLIGDPMRLNQVILNLLGNAIKFTKHGIIKIKVDLLSDTEETVKLAFSVNDTGIGIPQNKLSLIFEGFTQASNQTTRKYGGTGLGLTIAKQLVELQGGTISVESEVDHGSTFTFVLEFKKNLSPETNKKQIEETQNTGIQNLEGLKVLLVEDNILNQVLAKKVLSDWKCQIIVAENGLVAIDKLEKNDVDIILMDIQMPEMDGNEATRYIRKKIASPKSDVPIIAMTAHALAGEAEKCINAGMNDYISKPFDTKALYSKIESVLKKNNISYHK